MNKQSIDMLHGPIMPNIIKYTVPIMLTSLLQVMFNAADLVVVGRYNGSVALSAVGATSAISALIINLFLGLSVGGGVAVAHAVGCDNRDAVKRTVHTAIPAAFISGVFLTVFGIIFSRSFLQLMGTPTDIIELSTLYMRIYFCGMTFSMLYNFGASILRAVGDTKSPLVILGTAGVINVVLNVIFVTQFEMSVDGVALATIISQAYSAVMVLVTLMKRTDDCKLIVEEIRIYKAELRRMIKIGLPAGIQGSLFSISNVLIQSGINSFGQNFMAGSTAASNLESMVYVCLVSYLQTAVNFIGQNTGARQFTRVKKIFKGCIIGVTVTGVVLGVTVFFFGRTLLGIYVSESDPAIIKEVLDAGMIRLGFITLPYFVYGLVEVTTGALRGLGSSLAPMVMSVLGICGLRLLWLYTVFQIDRFHNPYGLFSSYIVSWIVTFGLQLASFLILYKRLKHTSVD